MKKLVFAIVVGMVGAGLAGPAVAGTTEPQLDSVRVWNGLAFDAVRANRASDADAARMFAMLNAAVYDAVNGIAAANSRRGRAPALVPGKGPRHGDQQAAAVTAAHAVLVSLDPARLATYDAQLAADLAKLHPGRGRTQGADWGRQVGGAVVANRTGDGSTPVESQPAGAGPGQFRAAWSGTQYRNMRPFAVADPAVYVPGAPPALTSLDYAAAFAEVALLGDQRIPDADKLATFQFWSLPAGSVQPPGEWMRIGLTVAGARKLSLADSARLAALLGLALADTTITTVKTKFDHRHWRVTTAVTEADSDGNDLTRQDTGWKARAGSVGSSPEWISGHSSFSAAGATVLSGFFCADNIAFRHATDSAPGGADRAYPSFSAAAAEAGRSRVFGGLHFEFSNQAGLGIGRGVGSEVLATRLLLRSGPTHHGQCPL